MKDVLIITNYYPPEIGAASNRIFQLAKGLGDMNFKVNVITPLPNYPTGRIYSGFRGRFIHKTNEQEINVFRLWIYANNSKNKILRFLAMISYSISLFLFFLFHKIPKTVIVQSPPLLVAFTCMLFLKKKKRKLILNVSDLWPSAGLELGVFKENFSYKVLKQIEKFNYKRADLVLGQSQEILEHVKSLNEGQETFLYRNFPDFSPPEIQIMERGNDKIKLVYAGLLGVAQGILKLCEKLDYSNVEFHIYGEGAEKEKLQLFIKTHQNLPITFHGQLDRKTLHEKLMEYDVAIIPLLNRIYGSVPSKIFEYARLGLPVIYLGGGEGERIIKSHHLGWIIKVGDHSKLNMLLSELEPFHFDHVRKVKIQDEAVRSFDFKSQLAKLSRVI